MEEMRAQKELDEQSNNEDNNDKLEKKSVEQSESDQVIEALWNNRKNKK